MADETTGQVFTMEGGLIVAGEHAAYAQSRLPGVDDALRDVADLEQALAAEIATEHEIESCEVSIATGGGAITHGTRLDRLGSAILEGDFRLEPDGAVTVPRIVDGVPYRLRFSLDCHVPDFDFDCRTQSTPEAQEWMTREKDHLARQATIIR